MNSTSYLLSPLQCSSRLFSSSHNSHTPLQTSLATSRLTNSQLANNRPRDFQRNHRAERLGSERSQEIRQTIRSGNLNFMKNNNNVKILQQTQSQVPRVPSQREPLKTRDLDQKWLTQTMGGPKFQRPLLEFSKKNENSIENDEPSFNKILQKLTEKQKLLQELRKIAAMELPTRHKNTKRTNQSPKKIINPGIVVQSVCQMPQNKNITLSIIQPKELSQTKKEDILKAYHPQIKAISTTNLLTLTSTSKNQDKNNLSPLSTSRSYKVSSPFHSHCSSSKFFKKDSTQTTDTLLSRSRHFSNKEPQLLDFKFLKKLGQGKFGTVFTALHLESGWIYALKKISKSVIKSHLMIEQLITQIKIQSFCSHQNIVRLYGYFDDDQHLYLILEYMEDGTLFEFLKKQQTLPELQAAEKVKDLTQAVKYLHDNGIAHRDIKPENIVIANGVGKLCDFGWAAICKDRRKTYCGTFDYAAPEILEGDQYDISVDLWCIGVLTYELLVGKAPFYHISRKETMKKIMNVKSDDLTFPASVSFKAVSFIQGLLKKQPEQRLNAEALLKHPFLTQVTSK